MAGSLQLVGKPVTGAGEVKSAIGQVRLAVDALYQRQFGLWHLPLFTRVGADGAVTEAEEIADASAIGSATAEPWGDFEKGPRGQVYRMPIAIRSADVSEPWYQLPNEPMVSFAGKVEVTKTRLNRFGQGKGTVTEEEALDDYAITIQGIAYNELSNAYPEEDMKQIRRLFERPGYLEVKNYLLNQILGINYLKIERWKGDRFERLTERWAPYTCECFSVTDFDLD